VEVVKPPDERRDGRETTGEFKMKFEELDHKVQVVTDELVMPVIDGIVNALYGLAQIKISLFGSHNAPPEEASKQTSAT
jgi:hypothetical protein